MSNYILLLSSKQLFYLTYIQIFEITNIGEILTSFNEDIMYGVNIAK